MKILKVSLWFELEGKVDWSKKDEIESLIRAAVDSTLVAKNLKLGKISLVLMQKVIDIGE